MDPVSAIAGAVSSIYDFYSGAVNYFRDRQMIDFQSRPGVWIGENERQRQAAQARTVIMAIAAIVIILVIAIVIKNRRA